MKDLILPWDKEGINYYEHDVHLIFHKFVYKIDLDVAKKSLNSKRTDNLIKLRDGFYRVSDISKDDDGRIQVSMYEVVFMA